MTGRLGRWTQGLALAALSSFSSYRRTRVFSSFNMTVRSDEEGIHVSTDWTSQTTKDKEVENHLRAVGFTILLIRALA